MLSVTHHTPNTRTRSYALLLAFLVILTVFSLRAIHLQADFPHAINWSGDLYTDEGWYARNAVAYHLTGQWHVEGDFNPAVNLPLLPVMEGTVFHLFGMSLLSARLLALVFTLLVVLQAFLLVRAYAGMRAALLCAGLLVTTFSFFAYSRLALLEMPMTAGILAGVLLAHRAGKGRAAIFYAICSAVALVLAVLVKSTAVFAVPVVVLPLLWLDRRMRIPALVGWALTFGCLLALYWFFLARPYRLDFAYFSTVNIASRFSVPPVFYLRRLFLTIGRGIIIDPILYPLGLAVSAIALFTISQLRKHPLIIISGLWVILYLLLIGLNGYTPPRYFVPLTVPLFILTAVVFDRLTLHIHPVFRWCALGIIVAAMGINLCRQVVYLASPQYTFLTMARDIQRRIAVDAVERPVLLGHFANSISLETGVLSINDTFGTTSLDERVARYRPSHYVSLGGISPLKMAVLAQYYDPELLCTYTVFGNYQSGRPVFFYRLRSKNRAGAP